MPLTSLPVAHRASPLPLEPDSDLPIGLDDDRLDTPAILVDLDVMDRNIDSMAALAARRGLSLRPHIKSHKSVAIARRQLAAGASGICVATVGEAEVMWDHGIGDILIAYSIIGARKLQRLRPLIDAGVVTLVADSLAVAERYSELALSLGREVPLLLEIDSGMHRVGVGPSEAAALAVAMAALPAVSFRGILTHAGHAHDAIDQRGIEQVAREEARVMQFAREEIERAGVEVPVVSAGSTITTPYLSAEDGITEVRPGTYVFNDLRTLSCFACTPDQIAATMLATVVSVGSGRVTVDAGSKSLTPTRSDEYGHGHLLNRPATRFVRLSEEHGVLSVSAEDSGLGIGDRVRILPVHACVWMDLQHEVYGMRGGLIVERIRIDAMRRSL
jgi:D-serine deaminase-like pyridoxal phosphate-dependent protein